MFNRDPVPQKLAKYTILLSIKEGYLFLRNTLGLLLHPFKTLRAMLREQDFSQILLIVGFPIYWFFGGLLLIWFGRRMVAAPPWDWGRLTKGGVGFVFLISTITFIYIGYWLLRVLKVKR